MIPSDSSLIHLYTSEDSLRWQQKSSRSRGMIIALFSAALLLGVLCCLLCRTRTAVFLQWLAVSQCTLLGWTAILLTAFVYRPARAEATHARGLLSAGDPETFSGLLTLTDARFPIPRSVTACRLTLQPDPAPDQDRTPVPLSLNLAASRVSRLPAASFPAQVEVVHHFITAFRPLSPAQTVGPAPAVCRPSPLRRLSSLFPMLLVWALLSLLLWSWIFSFLTDAAPARKVTLYVDGQLTAATDLAATLEESLPAGLRLVEVRPFSYFMMNGDALPQGDLFLLPESGVAAHRDWLCPVPPSLLQPQSSSPQPQSSSLLLDGKPFGLPVYDEAAGLAVAASHVVYADPYRPSERWFLCFGARSLHLPDHPDAVDAAALPIAEAFLRLP